MRLGAEKMCVGALLSLLISAPAWGETAEDFAPPKRPARFERLSVSLGFGLTSVAQGRFNDGVSGYADAIMARSPELTLDRVPKSQSARSLEVLARYYAPRHVFVESGLIFVQNGASTGLMAEDTEGRLSYENLVVEIPVVVGMYLPLAGQFYVYGGVGPSLFLVNRSRWNYDLGRISSFEASRGGGATAIGGADWMIGERVAVGLLVRYRYGKSSELVVSGNSLPPVQDLGELNISGIGASMALRVFAF